jgi:hypothetical protein
MNKFPTLICFLHISLIVLNSCGSKSSSEIKATNVESKQESTTADDGAGESQKEPESIDLNDTIDSTMVRVIDMKCAISVIPDTSWLNKQQEKLGEKWEEIAMDNAFYGTIAHKKLDSIGIPIINGKRSKHILLFVFENKEEYQIDLRELGNAWGYFLFNQRDKPTFWHNTHFDNELSEIFD